MALQNQVYIYSVDTKAFYTDEEDELEKQMIAKRLEKTQMKKDGADVSAITQELSEMKESLKEKFLEFDGVRKIRDEYLVDTNVVSIFESTLTRTLNMKTDELSDALLIIRVYFFEVFKNLCLNGFDINGEHYVCFTASAGQIRTKKCVFIKESLLNKYEHKLYCGLSVKRINELGGCNTNKYLAYLALCNSSTDVWKSFDIDRAIVVDDFETMVEDEVDYIDPVKYTITRTKMAVPVPHMDGCGMMLPRLTVGKNTMVRLPWIKGLLAVFPYDDWVREHGCSPVIKDIYGDEHDIYRENIEIIFTKSQFKMWKYYSNWEEYKNYFKEYGCEAGVCNMEEERIKNSTINYQMLQSLTDFTDDELERVCAKTKYKLEHISTNRKTMLKVFGAYNNIAPSPMQECLALYPELLQDQYFREELRELKASMEKDAWAGKLDIYSKYLFVIPDLYAFCEWLFMGVDVPEGILKNGEVYTEQFTSEWLDCLRSPSLYREHPVRKNVRDNELCNKWFGNKGIYTSTHDLISKILQFDCDGDKLLVVADPTIVEVARRNMENVVPLYYQMGKAQPHIIDNESIYTGMINAYTGGNIGVISNKISKIWNSENPDTEAIKLLVMQNNQCIDYAKTLFKTLPPKDIEKRINHAVKGKLPYFFTYAKDKELEQVTDRNDSTVNRIYKHIPKYKFQYTANKFPKFDYHMLMHNPNMVQTNRVKEIAKKYRELTSHIGVIQRQNNSNFTVDYRVVRLKEEMFKMGDDPYEVLDAIIIGIFDIKKSKRKTVFWQAFGDMVLTNLKSNLSLVDTLICDSCYMRFSDNDEGKCPCCGKPYRPYSIGVCVDCGEEFGVFSKGKNQLRCPECQAIFRRKYKADFIRAKRVDLLKNPSNKADS